MGNIVGGLIGGVGSILGASSAKSNDLTGYNYLTGANGVQPYVTNGTAANTASANLLGLNGAAGQSQSGPAFQNYLNSSGNQFQLDQGSRAITGNAASRGLLNSGSTAKSLTSFGQNLASTNFGNYLSQVNNQGSQGLTASGQIGQAGTSGGVQAGNAQQSGITNAFGQLAGVATAAAPLLGI